MHGRQRVCGVLRPPRQRPRHPATVDAHGIATVLEHEDIAQPAVCASVGAVGAVGIEQVQVPGVAGGAHHRVVIHLAVDGVVVELAQRPELLVGAGHVGHVLVAFADIGEQDHHLHHAVFHVVVPAEHVAATAGGRQVAHGQRAVQADRLAEVAPSGFHQQRIAGQGRQRRALGKGIVADSRGIPRPVVELFVVVPLRPAATGTQPVEAVDEAGELGAQDTQPVLAQVTGHADDAVPAQCCEQVTVARCLAGPGQTAMVLAHAVQQCQVGAVDGQRRGARGIGAVDVGAGGQQARRQPGMTALHRAVQRAVRTVAGIGIGTAGQGGGQRLVVAGLDGRQQAPVGGCLVQGPRQSSRP